MINLNHLRLFHFVAKYKSFTVASEKLFLTQPGISKQIKDLENYYATKLFDRSGKKTNLTQAGELVFEATQRIFENLNDLDRKIEDLKNVKTGKITIHSGHTPGIHLLPNAILGFKNKFEGVDIHYDISTSKSIFKKIIANKIDIGITAMKSDDTKIKSIPFIKDELILAIPNNHRLATQNEIHLTDIKHEKILVTKKSSATRIFIDEINNKYKLQLNMIEFGNPFAIVKSIESGNGISIMSKMAIQNESNKKLLHSKKINIPDFDRAFYLNYKRNKYIFNGMEEFISYFLRLHKFPN